MPEETPAGGGKTEHAIVRDGLVLIPGSPAWHWWRANRQKIEGLNPPAIDPKHPKAPVSQPAHGKPKRPDPAAPFLEHLAHNMTVGLQYAGRMIYSEGPDRSELFHRKPLHYLDAHADCSQDVASNLHWLGVKTVTDTDYTGTLLEKGKLVDGPAIGRVAIWGPGTGAHAAVCTEEINGVWYVVGFGHQGAPDRNTLASMNAYFDAIGEPGVRYLEFAA